MIRRSAIALAAFLFVLFVLGLCEHASVWLTYSVGAAVMLALGVAQRVPMDAPPGRAMFWPASVGAILFALAIFGLTRQTAPWLCWWILIVAFGFFGLAAMAPMLPRLRALRAT